jgi:hypothetical protein
MNPNLLEQFLGPSAQFFCFNTNDYMNELVSPTEKKTSLLTKRNIFVGGNSGTTTTTTPATKTKTNTFNSTNSSSSSLTATSSTKQLKLLNSCK